MFTTRLSLQCGPVRKWAPNMRPLKAGGSSARMQADLALVGDASVENKVDLAWDLGIGGTP